MSYLGVRGHVKLSGITTYSHIPALLLGQMARDSEYEGRGLGKLMHDWVIIKALEFGEQVGCRLVMLDSVPDKVDMYRNWGFVTIDLKDDKKRENKTMFVDLAWHGYWVLPT